MEEDEQEQVNMSPIVKKKVAPDAHERYASMTSIGSLDSSAAAIIEKAIDDGSIIDDFYEGKIEQNIDNNNSQD